MSGASGNISSSQLGSPSGSGYADPFGGSKTGTGDDTGSPLGGKTAMQGPVNSGPMSFTKSWDVPGMGPFGSSYNPEMDTYTNHTDSNSQLMSSLFASPYSQDIGASWGGMSPWDDRRRPGGGGGGISGWDSSQWYLY